MNRKRVTAMIMISLLVLYLLSGCGYTPKPVKAAWPLDGTVVELPFKAEYSDYDFENYGKITFSKVEGIEDVTGFNGTTELYKHIHETLEAAGVECTEYPFYIDRYRHSGYCLTFPGSQGTMYFCIEANETGKFTFGPMVNDDSIPWPRHLAYYYSPSSSILTSMSLEESLEGFAEFYESIGAYNVKIADNLLTVIGDDMAMTITFDAGEDATHVTYSVVQDQLYLLDGKVVDANGNIVFIPEKSFSNLLFVDEKVTGEAAYVLLYNDNQAPELYTLEGELLCSQTGLQEECYAGLYWSGTEGQKKVITDLTTGQVAYLADAWCVSDTYALLLVDGELQYFHGLDRYVAQSYEGVSDIYTSNYEEHPYCLVWFEDGTVDVVDRPGKSLELGISFTDGKLVDGYLVYSNDEYESVICSLPDGEVVTETNLGEVTEILFSSVVIRQASNSYVMADFQGNILTREYEHIDKASESYLLGRYDDGYDLLDDTGNVIFSSSNAVSVDVLDEYRLCVFDSGAERVCIQDLDGNILAEFDSCVEAVRLWADGQYLVLTHPDPEDYSSPLRRYSLVDINGNVVYQDADAIISCDGLRAVVEKDGRPLLIDMQGKAVASTAVMYVTN